MAITKVQSLISFKITVTSQLCFTYSRLSRRCSSEPNSRLLTHLSVDNSPSWHLSPSTTLLLLAEQVLPYKSPWSSALWHFCTFDTSAPSTPLHPWHLCTLNTSAPSTPLLSSYSFLVVLSLPSSCPCCPMFLLWSIIVAIRMAYPNTGLQLYNAVAAFTKHIN